MEGNAAVIAPLTQGLVSKIDVLETSESYGKFAVEPLERGFGTTLGNALRRVLLSALPGTAITAVRIQGVQHEYTTIPHMREDVTDFLLNVKSIRIRALTDQPGVLTLEVKGREGPVYARDIQPSGSYEIINPELYLATLDSSDAALEIEFQVERGTGYRQAESRNGQGTIGLLPVDCVFTPTKRINFTVERTRVGQVTDYDRLVLDIWTDKTIVPEEAVRQAAQILVDQFSLFTSLGRPSTAGTERTSLASAIPSELAQMPVEQLKLSSRTLNCLRRGKINTVAEVLQRTSEELMALRNFGERSLEELYEKLQALGIPVNLAEAKKPKRKAKASTEEEQGEPGAPQAAFSAGGDEEEEEEVDISAYRGRVFSPDDKS
ncbi:MAG: DNA-directed RNA polymerase subunit alpha [Chloroflexi bacterium]|nr:DNA-directed RNA polymerase subunit alpha [Chloroflexota bacterium]